MKKITDAEIVAKHDERCRERCKLELRIVNALIRLCESQGITMKIWEYIENNEDTPDIKAALFNLDEAHVILSKDGVRMGTIFLVFGNSGWDLVSDYSTTLEEFLKPINELVDKLQ